VIDVSVKVGVGELSPRAALRARPIASHPNVAEPGIAGLGRARGPMEARPETG
jgi:hypothetical protein